LICKHSHGCEKFTEKLLIFCLPEDQV